jgi:hypothetical protein
MKAVLHFMDGLLRILGYSYWKLAELAQLAVRET